jgi:hypothetical protein
MCAIVNGPAAGYLASIAFGWTAATCTGVMLLLCPVAVLYLHEKRRTTTAQEIITTAGEQLLEIACARTIWAAAGLIALFYIAPGFGTALFYKQQNDLHLTTHARGSLQLVAGAFGVVAAVTYAHLCRHVSLRSLLFWCIIAATTLNFGYLFYSTFEHAVIIDGLNSFGYTLAELAFMDLAVRATPPVCHQLTSNLSGHCEAGGASSFALGVDVQAESTSVPTRLRPFMAHAYLRLALE